MKQYIQLKIQNFVPTINLNSEDGTEKKLTQIDENILENTLRAANELGLEFDKNKSREDIYADILKTALESNEVYMTEVSEIQDESIEFGIRDTFDQMIEKAKRIGKEYKDIDMNEDARKEIDLNQRRDILASILEDLYLRLIAKTLIAAAELGILEVHLKDEHKNGRLAEKMNKELEKMGVELILD